MAALQARWDTEAGESERHRKCADGAHWEAVRRRAIDAVSPVGLERDPGDVVPQCPSRRAADNDWFAAPASRRLFLTAGWVRNQRRDATLRLWASPSQAGAA
jgi:hypothetical protein